MKKFKDFILEMGAGAAGGGNTAGGGQVAGIGVGAQGEPGVDRKKKRNPVVIGMTSRK